MSGRVFNALVRLFCGTRDPRFAMRLQDAERGCRRRAGAAADDRRVRLRRGLLYLARLAGFRIREVGIVCHCRQDSRVRDARRASRQCWT